MNQRRIRKMERRKTKKMTKLRIKLLMARYALLEMSTIGCQRENVQIWMGVVMRF